MYCYGVKLHLLVFRRFGTTPFPGFIRLTVVSENVLTAFKELFGDRIFSDKPYFDLKAKQQNIEMLTSVMLANDNSIHLSDFLTLDSHNLFFRKKHYRADARQIRES